MTTNYSEMPTCAQQEKCGISLRVKTKKGVTSLAVASCINCGFRYEVRRGNDSSVKQPPRRKTNTGYVQTSASGTIPEGLSLEQAARIVKTAFDANTHYERQPQEPSIDCSSGLFLPNMTPVIE
jgi:hypothetical protein